MQQETYRSRVKEISVNVINSRLESVRYKNIEKTGLRVYDNGCIGVAGAIGSYQEKELLERATDALNLAIAYPSPLSGNRRESKSYLSDFIAEERFVEEMEDLLAEVTARHTDFSFFNKINYAESHAAIENDAGLNLSYADKVLDFAIAFKEKSSVSLLDGFVGFTERKYDRKAVVAEFEMLLGATRKKAELPSEGIYPVIYLHNNIPFDKFISDLKGDIFSEGASLFSGKLGQKLFSESFTLSQKLGKESMLPFFDAEGTVNDGEEFNLITNGVLSAPYCDKKTAHRYGLAPSGSARAAYDGVPQSDLLSPTVKTSGKTIRELLGGQKAIYILMAAGGDYTPSGKYATPVQISLFYDGESLVGRLPELSISSDIYDMFGGAFRGVSTDSLMPFSTQTMGVIDMKVSRS